MEHKRIPSRFDECNYQVVRESPGQSETIAGYDTSEEADNHCMSLEEKDGIFYAVEMGPNVPEPD